MVRLFEIQRIESLTLQHQNALSRDHLKRLMTELLSDTEKQEVQALFAYNSHFLKDNINAYTQAKPIFEDSNSNIKTRMYAGLAFVLSAEQLERTEEAKSTLQILENIVTTNNNTLYWAYLDTLSRLPLAWINPDELQNKTAAFELRIEHIRATTKPNQEFLQALDNYIEKIMPN